MPRSNIYRISSRYLRRWTFTIIFSFLGSITHHSFAQTTADGTIHGHIIDSTGAAVSNAKITAHSADVGGTFTPISDGEGNYRLTELPPGEHYSVETAISGFERFDRAGLIVRAGLNVTVDIQVKIGSESQTVEVSGEAPLIDTQSAE